MHESTSKNIVAEASRRRGVVRVCRVRLLHSTKMASAGSHDVSMSIINLKNELICRGYEPQYDEKMNVTELHDVLESKLNSLLNFELLNRAAPYTWERMYDGSKSEDVVIS